jgi:hypothetical protein
MKVTSPGRKWYININKNLIRSNILAENPEPPITIRHGKYGKSRACMGVWIPDGSRIIYTPNSTILACGARLVIECPTEPKEDYLDGS